MSKTEGKDFMDDPVVDRLTDEILDALETSAAAHGLGKVKSVAIVAIASDGTGGGRLRGPFVGLHMPSLPGGDGHSPGGSQRGHRNAHLAKARGNPTRAAGALA